MNSKLDYLETYHCIIILEGAFLWLGPFLIQENQEYFGVADITKNLISISITPFNICAHPSRDAVSEKQIVSQKLRDFMKKQICFTYVSSLK